MSAADAHALRPQVGWVGTPAAAVEVLVLVVSGSDELPSRRDEMLSRRAMDDAEGAARVMNPVVELDAAPETPLTPRTKLLGAVRTVPPAVRSQQMPDPTPLSPPTYVKPAQSFAASLSHAVMQSS